MKIITLIILTFIFAMSVVAQDMSSYPDTIHLNKKDIQALYRAKGRDTLEFKVLTSTTSLNEYKDNKPVMQALKSIKKFMRNDIVYDKIAGTPITTLKNYPSRNEETLVLRNPKYRISQKGIFIVGKSESFAPWNDIILDIVGMDCYFVGFDKRVKLMDQFVIEKNPKESIGTVIFDTKGLTYTYPEDVALDTLSKYTHPVLISEETDLVKYFEENIHYPKIAIEVGLRGLTFADFIVNPDKTISNLRLYRRLSQELDEEIFSAIRQTSGLWIPGAVNDEEVPVKIRIAVRFEISIK